MKSGIFIRLGLKGHAKKFGPGTPILVVGHVQTQKHGLTNLDHFPGPAIAKTTLGPNGRGIVLCPSRWETVVGGEKEQKEG